MKNLIQKLNNFKLTALIEAGIQLFGALIVVGYLLSYSFAGDIVNGELSHAFPFESGNMAPQFLGMFFFLSCVFALIVSIVVIYQLFPFITNKTKVSPKKIFLIVGICNSIFFVGLIILSILVIIGPSLGLGFWEMPNSLVGFIISMVCSVLFIAINIFSIYPISRCEFYMPEVNKK